MRPASVDAESRVVPDRIRASRSPLVVFDPEQIRRAWERRPFRPFVMRLGDGETLRVPRPSFLWLSGCGGTVIVELPSGSFEVLDTRFVVAIEEEEPGD